LSSFLFDETFKEIVKEKINFIPPTVTLLVYADDLTLVGSDEDDVVAFGKVLEDHLMEYNLRLKQDKEMISSTYYDFTGDHKEGIKRNRSGTVLKFPLGEEAVNTKWEETLEEMRVGIEDQLNR